MSAVDKKRYVLYSKEDGRPDAEKPCAFFASAAGCRNAANCRFSHTASFSSNGGAAAQVKPEREAAAPTTSSAALKPKKEKREKKEKKEERPPQAAPVQQYQPPVQQYKAAPVQQYKAAPVQQQQQQQYQPPAQQYQPPVQQYQPPVQQYQPPVQQYQPPVQQYQPPVQQYQPPNDRVVLELQQQLLEQQKLLQEQILLNQARISQPAPAAVAPSTGSDQKDKKRKQKQENNSANKTSKVAEPSNAGYTPFQHAAGGFSAGFSAMAGSSSADEEDDDNDLLFGAVNHVLNAGVQPITPYKQPENFYSAPAVQARPPVDAKVQFQDSDSDAPALHTMPEMSSSNPFASSEETMRALQTSGSKHALHGPVRGNIFASPKGQKAAPPAGPAQTLPVPAASKTPFNPSAVQWQALPWGQLVAATQAHPKFAACYSFSEDSSWVRPRPFSQSNGAALPPVLSIDCEMCETSDPVTGEKVGDTLIRFSVVDAMAGGKVLVDSLVQPGLPVSDLRANIHGITEEMLAQATWTLRHAQAALLNLCTDRTIIIGHSLHKDLKSLHFNHACVIDTAFLYTVDREPGAAPSLRDASDQVLGMRLPEPHDSVQDAQAALYVASVLLTAGPQAPIVRSNGGAVDASPSHPSLLIHRIPDYCSEQNIHDMIASYTQVMPLKVSPIARGQTSAGSSGPSIPSGKASVFFRTLQHCDLAFESITGPNRPDKQNRDQKRVYFKGGGYVCVRK
ncbi:hypothetical protein B484DRAFT_360816 [Ochromonadaceae sp. CCMP2298]|nr:hypothetical protein B484DRAFT_360816 [Ochromonadaceae sp. CCMP2298]